MSTIGVALASLVAAGAMLLTACGAEPDETPEPTPTTPTATIPPTTEVEPAWTPTPDSEPICPPGTTEELSFGETVCVRETVVTPMPQPTYVTPALPTPVVPPPTFESVCVSGLYERDILTDEYVCVP